MRYDQTVFKVLTDPSEEKIIEVVANIMMFWGEGISPQTLQSLWYVKRNGMGIQFHLPSEHHVLNSLLHCQLLPIPCFSKTNEKSKHKPTENLNNNGRGSICF